MARSDYPVPKNLCEKIATFCDVEEQSVIPLVTADILYEIPLILEEAGVADILLRRLNLVERNEPDWREWRWLINEVRHKKPGINIALVGKYVELHDAYLSIKEALNHAALHQGVDVHIQWVQATDLEKDGGLEKLHGVDGILVPGGFGSRGIEGKIAAARYARSQNVPYLGLCLGLQVMVIEAGRVALGDEKVNSSEFDTVTPHPVIDLMPDQYDVTNMGGTMRLGLYPCHLVKGSKAADAYKIDLIEERHRHRFEVNNAYREVLQKFGMVFSGVSPDNRLVEIAEIKDHPFMLGCQFHPEFLSRPNKPHPLFSSFIAAVCDHAGIDGDIIPLDQ